MYKVPYEVFSHKNKWAKNPTREWGTFVRQDTVSLILIRGYRPWLLGALDSSSLGLFKAGISQVYHVIYHVLV